MRLQSSSRFPAFPGVWETLLQWWPL